VPYPANLSRVVLSGVLFGVTGDEWAMSYHMLDLGGTNAPPNAGRLMELSESWFRTPGARISDQAYLQRVKANRIGSDGRYLDQVTNEAPTSYGTPGCNGTATGPAFPQLSVAVSLLTPMNRGLASRGRFYPPMNSVSLGSDGHISAGQTIEIAEAAASYLTQIHTAFPGWRVVVASKRGGVLQPVTRVAVGDVVDTQSRRRQQLLERYEYRPVTGQISNEGIVGGGVIPPSP
jgi:hypothetical protein